MERQSEPAATCNTTVTDSRNVPDPPGWLSNKRAREIWREKFADPATRIWFKNSDHAFIARYCQRRAEYERFVKRKPAATYETFGASGRIIRKNPEFVMMQDLHRDLRADEQLLAGNPVARVDMEKRTLGGDRGAVPPNGKDDAANPSGPLGMLKRSRQDPPVRPN